MLYLYVFIDMAPTKTVASAIFILHGGNEVLTQGTESNSSVGNGSTQTAVLTSSLNPTEMSTNQPT